MVKIHTTQLWRHNCYRTLQNVSSQVINFWRLAEQTVHNLYTAFLPGIDLNLFILVHKHFLIGIDAFIAINSAEMEIF